MPKLGYWFYQTLLPTFFQSYLEILSYFYCQEMRFFKNFISFVSALYAHCVVVNVVLHTISNRKM
ncbi:uncharacterized protein BX663DRAFT_204217 [Cokeromyces recurvatus]|uniref:uncharacterized protein n=1 Tax=Cokeromyces recurvatus TaxID=90255 RepID=UPI002220E56E|nr:uncharacterized protein BX663DRAFT_204217 [Cokeromyces recurvatus]KAI7906755.1 hypothetical protein BX663DRAFT_204217 [Cokeromyces recurvatus]